MNIVNWKHLQTKFCMLTVLIFYIFSVRDYAHAQAQSSQGDCSPNISGRVENITVICNDRSVGRIGSIEVTRFSRLLPTREAKDDFVAFDAIISNGSLTSTWVEDITLIGLGNANTYGCNPNPVATFRYKVELSVSDSVEGVVFKEADVIGAPITGTLKGSMEHQYCDGYLLINYRQDVEIPSKQRISYVLIMNAIELDFSAAYPFPENYPPDRSIPRLGLSINEINIAGAFGHLDRESAASEVVSGSGPGYFLPIWTNWIVIFRMSDGQFVHGQLGSSTSLSAYGSIEYEYLRSDALAEDLLSIGFNENEVRTLLE